MSALPPEPSSPRDPKPSSEALALLLCDLRAVAGGPGKKDLWRLAWSTLAYTPLFTVILSPWVAFPESNLFGLGLALAYAGIDLQIRLNQRRHELLHRVIHQIAAVQNDLRRQIERLESAPPAFPPSP